MSGPRADGDGSAQTSADPGEDRQRPSLPERLGRLLLPTGRRFPPAECRRLRRGVPEWAIVYDLESIVVSLATAAFFLAGLLTMFEWFRGDAQRWAWRGVDLTIAGWAAGAVWLGVLVGGAATISSVGNEALWWRGARRAMKRRRCRWCRATLVHDGRSPPHVKCTRCGKPNLFGPAVRSVAEIVEWDRLVNPPSVLRVPARCVCGYHMAGLPTRGGAVTCPECGVAYPTPEREPKA